MDPALPIGIPGFSKLILAFPCVSNGDLKGVYRVLYILRGVYFWRAMLGLTVLGLWVWLWG